LTPSPLRGEGRGEGRVSFCPSPRPARKEQLLWVRTFDTVEELRLALLEFTDRYHGAWLIERHGHQTPAAVRAAFTVAVEVAA